MFNSQVAYQYLLNAKKSRTKAWITHSYYVGKSAGMIAAHIKGMNSDLAEAYGYVHDIGRSFGEMKINHIFFGYRFLTEEGYADAARICLTHSFPVQDIRQVTGVWDCNKAEYEFLAKYLAEIQYTKYDQLIQLCDVIGSAQGITIMEKRLVDIVRRYGIDAENLIGRWDKLFQLKAMFEEEVGCSLEKILGLREKNCCNEDES